MKNLGLIIEREYSTRVKKKSFIILTLVMPLLFVGIAFVPLWLSTINESGTRNIAVIDQTGMYSSTFKSNENFNYQILSDKSKADESKLGEELYAILQITGDLRENPNAITLTSKKQVSLELQQEIERSLSEKVRQQHLEDLSNNANVDASTIQSVKTILENDSKIRISTLRLDKDGGYSETSSMVSTAIGFMFTILIYMFIMVYGGMVMQSVMEEKRSRIVEVMISSIKPVDLLVGKIVAIGLVGLTQLFIWVLLIASMSFAGASVLGISTDAINAGNGSMSAAQDFDMKQIAQMLFSINWFEILISFILYFIGGYVLYASIFAVIGASVDNEQDTQQFMMPITILLLFAFYAGIYSVNNPDGPLAFWGSFIPFSSPIVMMVRIPFGIPFWQIAVSLVVLYATFIGIAYMAAKIYRVGILMYGKKPTLKEIIRWTKYS